MNIVTCPDCGGRQVRAKAIELRHIQSASMKITAREQFIEYTCPDCEWVDMQAIDASCV